MRVTIKRFRSWDSLALNFEAGQIHLLKGPSGVGKSTVFAAIQWCLYGNVRSVTPLDTRDGVTPRQAGRSHSPRAATSVVLEMDGFRAARSRAPNLLRVNDLEGDDAQRAIDARFGPWALFSVTSIVSQKERNQLLAMSNAEKLDVLRMLSLGADDPDRYIKILEEKIALDSEKLTKWETKRKRADADLLAMPPPLAPGNPARLASLRTQLPSLVSTFSMLEQAEIAERRAADKNAQNSALRAAYSAQLASLPRPETSTRVSSHQLSEARATAKTEESRASLAARIASIDLSGAPDCPACACSPKAAQRALEAEAAIRHEQKVAAQLSLAYDPDAFTRAHQEWELVIAQAAYARLTPPDEPPNIVVQDPIPPEDRSEALAALQARVASLEVKRMTCPHCSGAFYIQGSAAHRLDAQEAGKEALDLARRELRALTETAKAEAARYAKESASAIAARAAAEHARRQYEKDAAAFARQEQAARALLCGATPNAPSPAEVKAATAGMRATDSVCFPRPPPLSSAHILACVRYASLRKELEALQKELAALPPPAKVPDVAALERLREAYVKSKAQARAAAERRAALVQDLAAVPEDLPADPAAAETRARAAAAELQDARDEIAALQDAEKHAQAARAARACHDKQALYQQRLSVHKKLRQLVGDAECEAYSNTLDSINSLIEELVPQLFTAPISASLQGFKTAKTTRATKQNLNFSVRYGDAQLDSIRQLSGGEGDRLSLLLTIALHRQTSCPLLLLDECFASLDSDAKDLALDVVRQYTDCAVLVIQHDGVQGSYDEETDLSDHR